MLRMSATSSNTSQSTTPPLGMANQTMVPIACDFAGPVEDHMFLVIADSHSKWIEAFALKSATSATVIQCMRPLFARFGLPDTLVSDNGTCFVSAEFKHFWNATASGTLPRHRTILRPTGSQKEPCRWSRVD